MLSGGQTKGSKRGSWAHTKRFVGLDGCVCVCVGAIREGNWPKKRKKIEDKMQMAALEIDGTGIRQKSEARWKTQKAAVTVDSGGGGGRGGGGGTRGSSQGQGGG